MQDDLIIQAWAAFDDAVQFDETRIRFEAAGHDRQASLAAARVEKHLDRAIAFEKSAFADTAVAA